MTGGFYGISRFFTFLRTFYENFNRRFKYPLIIFYPEHVENEMHKLWEDAKNGLNDSFVFLQKLEFLDPEYFPKMEFIGATRHGVPYRHMCRFQSRLIHTHPIMADLEYGWRLDDDSIFLGPPIEYDLFQFMKKNDLSYGFVGFNKDIPGTTQNLWENVTTYAKDNNIKPTFLQCWPPLKVFYNNFEISKLSFWRSDEYIRYFKFIDQLGGIYKYRWGDAPIKGLALSLFMPPSKIHMFENIGYFHNSHNKKGYHLDNPTVNPLSKYLPCLRNNTEWSHLSRLLGVEWFSGNIITTH